MHKIQGHLFAKQENELKDKERRLNKDSKVMSPLFFNLLYQRRESSKKTELRSQDADPKIFKAS